MSVPSDRPDQSETILQGRRTRLLDRLIKEIGGRSPEAAIFKTCDDGGMGSFYVGDEAKRLDGYPAISARYRDEDGVDVIITVFADASGLPTEVEFWKVDFSALEIFPSPNELREIAILE